MKSTLTMLLIIHHAFYLTYKNPKLYYFWETIINENIFTKNWIVYLMIMMNKLLSNPQQFNISLERYDLKLLWSIPLDVSRPFIHPQRKHKFWLHKKSSFVTIRDIQ